MYLQTLAAVVVKDDLVDNIAFLIGAESKGITMNRINKQMALSLLLLLVSSLTNAQAFSGNPPTEEQVAKLAAAVSKERPHSIDVTLYLELTMPAKPIEQISKEVEGFFENERNMIQQRYEPNSLGMKKMDKRINRQIERNIERIMKEQQFPRLMKKRIRDSGHNHRSDSVTAKPGEELEPNMPFEHTFVNFGERNSPEFYSFSYHHNIKSAHIENESGWYKRDTTGFANMHSGPVSLLQAILSTNQVPITEPTFVPDINKMQELSRTGIGRMQLLTGVHKVRVSVTPEKNAPGNKDRIEIGDPNKPYATTVMVCDRDDYSSVYNLKFCKSKTGEPYYIRECSNFDSQGFPRNVTEIQYDMEGNLKEKSVYNIVSVDLNPSFPDDLFAFNPPEGYKVVDNRTKKP